MDFNLEALDYLRHHIETDYGFFEMLIANVPIIDQRLLHLTSYVYTLFLPSTPWLNKYIGAYM